MLSLIEAFERVEAARGEVSLSYFEFGTLAAFLILADKALDFAVMEVGLGGRLDAVNLLDADCAVITPVGLDHQEYLGNDLDSIGTEKAGIIRPGRPLVCGESEPPASILEIASRNGAPVVRLGKDFSATACGDHSCFRMGGLELELPLPALRGAHQLNNAATGLAAVLQLVPEAAGQPDALARGLARLNCADVSNGFTATRMCGSMWGTTRWRPRSSPRRCVRVAPAAGARFAACWPCWPTKMPKRWRRSSPLVISSWYCAGLLGDRGQSGRHLAQRVASVIGTDTVKVFERVQQALQAALSASGPDDGVLVFGSFHTSRRGWARMMVNLPNGAGATG